MNFLNVGPWELAVILIIAILVVGPQRVLEVVQAIRRFSGQLRKMSAEFTSQIQSEIRASGRETGQVPEGMASGEPAPVAGSEDKPPPIKRGPGEELEDVVREGLAPIVSLQSELRDTAQKTRQALESIVVEDELEPIADAEAEAESRTTARPTRQASQGVAESEPEEG